MTGMIKFEVEEIGGGYDVTVWVNDDFYAGVFSRDLAAAMAEAEAYAAQIEFDEDGNW